MNLSWSVLALALMGAQDQQPSQPKSPGSPIAIEIDISGPEMVKSASCRKAATAIAVRADAGTVEPASRKSGAVARLLDYCIERCVDLVVDQAEAAIVARLTEVPPSTPGTAADGNKPGYGVSPSGVAPATLPMQLPKVAKPRTPNDPEAAELWPMTLPEAFHVALNNSEVVRVISPCPSGPVANCFGPPDQPDDSYAGPIVVARLNADVAVWRFKAEIMAEVRSVEQQYWSLAQAHVQLWAADRAVNLAQEVLKREEAELTVGKGTVADVAEAAQRLEQFNLDLVTRTSDVITSERQLRNLLGLPVADNRRIIPVTQPTSQRIEYDWDTCLGEMKENQPDIVQQTALVRLAEIQLLIARNQLIPRLSLDALYQLNGLGQQLDFDFAIQLGKTLKALDALRSGCEDSADLVTKHGDADGFPNWQTGYTYPHPMGRGGVNSRQAQYILLKSRAHLGQIEHQTTHSLARFFLGVDANYKQYKTSVRLRSAAAQRLDAQRAYYEEGRITTDRFLDAISQYATAVATEAQYQTTYNVALAALAEAKGTLLADRDIVIATGPKRRNPYIQATQPQKHSTPPAPPNSVLAAHPPIPVPSDSTTSLKSIQWKGTKDLMAVAVAFAAGMPQDVELPQGLSQSPLLTGFGRARLLPRLMNTPQSRPAPAGGSPTPENETALEVPRVGEFGTPPVSSVNNAVCCGPAPLDTSAGTKDQASGPSIKCDGACTPAKAESGSAEAKATPPVKPKTWTFSLSIGGGPNPLQIKGTITEGATEPKDAAGH
ncbi:MAG: TolC family protein [Isosphaeraceae bacterium]